MLNNPRTKHTCFWGRRRGWELTWRNKNFSQRSQAVGPCQKKLQPKVNQTQGFLKDIILVSCCYRLANLQRRKSKNRGT